MDARIKYLVVAVVYKDAEGSVAELQRALDETAKDGWELVTALPTTDPRLVHLVFKQPASASPEGSA